MSVDRSEFTDARPRDVALLKALFAEGKELTKQIALDRYRIPGRRFRASVSELRRGGYPIVSFSTAGSTYRIARSEAELETFIRAEILSRASDLFTQAAAMRRDARIHFSPIQPELIRMGGTRG
jgi:hypothetical protein